MMRIVYLSIVIFSITGCLKNDGDDACEYDQCASVAPASEIQEVQNYLTTQGITAVKHCSGVFYKIESPGSGSSPNVCSAINAKYKGQLTNGTIFDQGEFPRPLQLGSLIKGWVNTLPLIKQGGKIHLYIPPALGYGNQAVGSIPPNSILIFDIELTFVQ